jgi:beta-lactamase class A
MTSPSFLYLFAAYYNSGEYTEQIESCHEAALAEVGKIAAAWAVV